MFQQEIEITYDCRRKGDSEKPWAIASSILIIARKDAPE